VGTSRIRYVKPDENDEAGPVTRAATLGARPEELGGVGTELTVSPRGEREPRPARKYDGDATMVRRGRRGER
jgi:hypothetical protein